MEHQVHHLDDGLLEVVVVLTTLKTIQRLVVLVAVVLVTGRDCKYWWRWWIY